MSLSPNEQDPSCSWIDKLVQQEPEFVRQAMAFVTELKNDEDLEHYIAVSTTYDTEEEVANFLTMWNDADSMSLEAIKEITRKVQQEIDRMMIVTVELTKIPSNDFLQSACQRIRDLAGKYGGVEIGLTDEEREEHRRYLLNASAEEIELHNTTETPFGPSEFILEFGFLKTEE